MANRTGVVPTLFLNTQVINTDSDIAAYILKFLFWNPGRTSNQIENTLVSMRHLSATYAENINTFPQALEDKLTSVLKRYCDRWTAEVSIIDRSNDKLTYGLNIKLTDGSGNLLINTDSLMVKDGLLTVRNEMNEDGSYETRSLHKTKDTTAYNILTTAGILTINKIIRTTSQMIETNKDIIFYSDQDASNYPDELKNMIASKSFDAAIYEIDLLNARYTAVGNIEVHEKLTDEEITTAQEVLMNIRTQLVYAKELNILVTNNDVEKLAQIFPNVILTGDLSPLLD